MAEIGPTGILSVGPSYSERSKEGELRAARTGARDYHLKLQPIRTEDQGQYFCRAWPSDRGQDGAFTQRAAQDSSPQLISISATGQPKPTATHTNTLALSFISFKGGF